MMLYIIYNVAYDVVIRKTQTSQSGFPFWFEFIQQGLEETKENNFLSMPFLPPWQALHHVRSIGHASFSTDFDLQLAERAHCAWCLMPPYFVFTVVKIWWQQRSLCKCRCLQPSLKFSEGSNMEHASGLAWLHGQTSWGHRLGIREAARLRIAG